MNNLQNEQAAGQLQPYQQPPVPGKRRIFPKIFLIALVIFFIILGVAFSKAVDFSSKLFVNSHTSFLKKLASIIFDPGIKGEAGGKISILLLGYGGIGHDGSYLTDSIIIATIDTNAKQILLQSIPRDYYWPSGQQKINYAYAAGVADAAAKNHDEKTEATSAADQLAGGQEAISAVQQISGLRIPYFTSLDFSGFEKAVDAIGGLDINIQNTFTDSQYPDDTNNGYLPPITFTAGAEHINGVRALEFARSRHAEGPEGSDFARSKRQTQILEAFKNKVQQLNILSDSSKINNLLNIIADHAHTNIDPNEVLDIGKLLKDKKYRVTSEDLDLNNPLFCPKIMDVVGYTIVPCDGVSDAEVKDYFANGAAYAAVSAEKTKIILENAGTDTALYNNIKQSLTGLGATVYEVPYKGLPLPQSQLFLINSDTASSKPATIKYIQDRLGIVAQPKPDQMKASSDLVLIVGG